MSSMNPHIAPSGGGGSSLATPIIHEYGGLEADVSAYSGIPKISGGATSQAVAGTDYARRTSISSLHAATLTASIYGYDVGTTSGITTALALTAGTLYGYLFRVPDGASVIQNLSVYITTGVAATNVRCGIYTVTSLANLYQDALVANTDSGDLSSASSNTLRTFTPGATVTLTPGDYYWRVMQSSGAPSVRGLDTTGAAKNTWSEFGLDSAFSTWGGGVSIASSYGSLPATFPASATLGANVRLVGIRWAS